MSKAKSYFSEYFQILLSVGLASIGLKAFLLPNNFLDGGATGIAILISEFIPIDISYILPIVSLPFFALGWYSISKRILLKSLISILLLALVLHFESFTAITDEKLLIAIFGGIFLGAGIGLGIKNGAVLDGSEILGIYINEKYGFPISRVILIFNIILFSITALVVSVEVALYSILTFIVTAKTIDYVFKGFEDYIHLLIVSRSAYDIEKALIEQANVGITVVKGTKGYGQSGKAEDIEIIQTVINRIDSNRVYRAIEEADDKAFIVELDVNNVSGGLLRKYLSK